MSKVIPIKVENQSYTETVSDNSNSKDWAMVKNMAAVARTKPQKNVTPLIIQNNIIKNTSLVLLMLPEWGVYFPPYNLSRLAGITRAAGFKTTIFDINIKSWNKLKDTLEFDPWDPAREWCWQGDGYFKELHPHLESIFNEYIDQVVALNPTVIGFSLYYTNEEPSNWVANELRKRLPNAKIIAGGPQAGSLNHKSLNYYDTIVIGEGEQLLVDYLEKIENNTPIIDKTLIQPKTVRLDLDSLPLPDYSDFNFNEYQTPNGVSSELSRGCVAKCVFCTEVHFWKYRGRMGGSVLNEIEHQYKTYGIDFVWFIDSLVNGNLKELRAFAQGIIERKLPIRWQGYARCDGRMDLEYYKDLAASGCNMLNYGVESGSQRVLDLMKKAITVEEIEANIRDAAATGVASSTQWILGFPGEEPQDVADTFSLVWRIRKNVINIAPGITMMLSPGAEVTDYPDKFAISSKFFSGAWALTDLSNTKVHRLIRQKSFNILLEHLNTEQTIYGFARPELHNSYSLTYDKNNVSESVPREEFDYNIITPGINVFADSIVNEIWPLLRTLWKAVGPYTITVKFDPTVDAKEFGFRIASDYTATHSFIIDNNGMWKANFYYKFIQEYSPGWDDYSFEYQYVGAGQWS